MMMGAMDVPVAMACVVEQADVAVDVVAAEQEPASSAGACRAGSRWLPRPPATKKRKLTSAEKRVMPELWDHHCSFLDADGGDLTVRMEQLAAKVEEQRTAGRSLMAAAALFGAKRVRKCSRSLASLTYGHEPSM